MPHYVSEKEVNFHFVVAVSLSLFVLIPDGDVHF